MSPFAVFAICIQVCLLQSVMSDNCGCGSNIYNNLGSYSPSGPNSGLVNLGNYGTGNAALNSVRSASCATYGGMGTGQVGVAGDVSACGNTIVVGSVPVLGAVDFSGVIPASGSVSISGQCGCGCQ